MPSELDTTFADNWAKRMYAFKLLGGRCAKCHLEDHRVIHFHHHDSNKVKAVSRFKSSRWSDYWAEASKCTPLCSNCHCETHTESESKRSVRKTELLSCLSKVKCERCGYAGRNLGSLHFHHTKDKQFTVSAALRDNVSVQRLMDEISKCEVICANCHTIEHIDSDRLNELSSLIEERMATLESRVYYKPADEDAIMEMYRSGCYNISEIATKLQLSMSTVSTAIFKRNKLPAANNDEQKMLDMFAAGSSQREIATALNCSRGRVKYILKTRSA